MTVRLRQYVPAFVNDGDGGWTLSSATLSGLLSDPAVAVYARDVEPVERLGEVSGMIDGAWKTVRIIHPAPEARRFYQWSLADGDKLMAEHNHGDHFRVVGFLAADNPAEFAALPRWEETDTARRNREAWNRGETGPPPTPYRCAEHGVAHATCCLPRSPR